jgi:hypothetical protein
MYEQVEEISRVVDIICGIVQDTTSASIEVCNSNSTIGSELEKSNVCFNS